MFCIGYILKDAIDDVCNLHAFIVQKYFGGNFTGRAILEAESMGGAICTLLNERHSLFDGIMACGAALQIRIDPRDEGIDFLYLPRKPLLFLTNVSEISQIRQYVRQATINQAKILA